MGLPNIKYSMEDLFGIKTVKVVHDLPCRINYLSDALRMSCFNYPADLLIRKHTLYSLYEPFIPKTLAGGIYKRMLGDGGLGLHSSLGLCASYVPTLKYFKFCPVCDSESVDRYGERYLHRMHQNPCVVVCPYHDVLLVESEMPLKSGILKATEFLVSDATQNKLRSIGNYTSKDFNFLIRISKAFEYILSGKYNVHFDQLRNIYLNLLKCKDLLLGESEVRIDELKKQFSQFYSDQLLNMLGSEITQSYCNWLVAIFRKRQRVFHPIRHILIILFLSESIEEFCSYKPVSELSPRERKNGPRSDYDHHYGEIIVLRQKYPEMSRQELKKMAGAAYQWIHIHDKDWFEKNMPAKIKPKAKPKNVDWEQKDNELLNKVKLIVSDLLNRRQPFLRLTVNLICNQLEKPYQVLRNMDKLPNTQRYLDFVVETPLQFQYRKIEQVLSEYQAGELTEDFIYREASIVKYRFLEIDNFIITILTDSKQRDKCVFDI